MKKRKEIVVFLAAGVVALCLAGCQNVKEDLGVGRNSPDEFSVVERAPLSLPPDYTLRPPAAASAAAMAGTRAAVEQPQKDAKAALLGQAETQDAVSQSGADATFLDETGADKANPDIRGIISHENGYIVLKDKTLADKLIFWKGPDKVALPSSVVNAPQEAARLKKNAEEGKPVTAGTVPVIEKRQSAFDKLF